VQRLTYFTHVLDIEGLGIRTAQLLVDKKMIDDPADLFSIQKSDLLNLEGFADKKAENLLEAISLAKNQPYSRVLAALGIRGVGETVAQLLVKHYPSLDSLQYTSPETLTAIDGMGPVTAENIHQWFQHDRNQQMVEKLDKAGMQLIADVVDTGENVEKSLTDYTFVITGTLSQPRDAVKALIESHGGKVTGSVSKNTTYLIMGETPGASKQRKAQSLNIQILDEVGLNALINNME
jgi:DNA ligase (NAD+)